MAGETGPNPEEMGIEGEANVKNEFLGALNTELDAMQQSGRISSEQAEEKKKAAGLIETGFSDNPEQDALLFSRAGIAGEKELIDIFENPVDNDTIKDTSLNSVEDFVEITEDAKVAFEERMQKDIDNSEKKELEQAMSTADKVAKYFQSLVRKMDSDMSVSQIEKTIKNDQERLEKEKQRAGKTLAGTKELSEREGILRLAVLAVETAKEKK